MNIENKLNLFTQAVYGDAEKQRDEILQTIQKTRETKLSDAEIAVLEESYHRIQSEVVKIRGTYKKQVSKEIFDYRKQLLEKREEIISEVFAHVQDRIKRYLSTPEYQASLPALAKNAADALGSHSITFFMRSEDKCCEEAITSLLTDVTCQFAYHSGMELGGLLAKSEKDNRLADETFAQRLELAKHDFIKESGLSLDEI